MQLPKHMMSKAAYRVHLMGMCVRVMRSMLFNLMIFAAGIAFGMGFTVVKLEQMLQYGDEVKTVALLKKVLKHHSIHDKCVDECLMKIKAEKDIQPSNKK